MLSARNIVQSLRLNSCEIQDLFALRLLLDDPQDIVDLDKDINDLTIYPERLFDSYRDEWIRYISRSLAKRCKTEERSNEVEFLSLLGEQLIQIQEQTNERFQTLLPMVKRAQGIAEDPNVATLPHPLKTQLQQWLKL